jgi:hypothetical protein
MLSPNLVATRHASRGRREEQAAPDLTFNRGPIADPAPFASDAGAADLFLGFLW